MQALAILESFDLRDGAQLARYIHTIAEALKLAFAASASTATRRPCRWRSCSPPPTRASARR